MNVNMWNFVGETNEILQMEIANESFQWVKLRTSQMNRRQKLRKLNWVSPKRMTVKSNVVNDF